MFPQLTITARAALRDLSSRKPRTRVLAALALGDVRAPDVKEIAIRALCQCLRDPAAEVRSAAAQSLGELGGDQAADALIPLLDDPVSATRQSVAIALGSTGSPAAYEPLERALGSPYADLRFQAATSLCELDPERAVTPLLRALADEDPEVVSAVALALGACGHGLAIEPLVAALSTAPADARPDIAYALARLGDARGVPCLIACLQNERLAWDAIEGLEMTGEASAAVPLAGLLANPRLPREQRLRAAGALLALDPESPHADAARADLLRGLRAFAHHVRALAVAELARAGGPWALAGLSELSRRRAGRHLREEITTAVDRISSRALPPHAELNVC